jgi:glycosyltransferase involved in cell wall biosynthesis
VPRLLYLVSEDWYFLSHRLPMARAARAAGYEVHVATHIVDGGEAIASEGFVLHPLGWKRGSTNPIDFVGAVFKVRRLYRKLAPDLVHQVALWPAVVGSCAALGLPVRQLSALAGLGFVFASSTAKARMVRGLLRGVLRLLFDRPRAAVLVQNPDDRATMASIGISPERLFVIPGSGVDTDWFTPLPEPGVPVTVAYVGRLLAIKGLRTLIAAHERLAKQHTPVRLLIAGKRDSFNPASIPAAEIDSWRGHPGISVLGHVEDIRTVWAAAHIAVQPSRGGEGLPKSLLEAAACGRPMVATDVPGCREIARSGLNALTVAPDDPDALAEAIDRLARDPALRAQFGTAGRQLVEAEFSSARVGRDIVALYGILLGPDIERPRPSKPARASE